MMIRSGKESISLQSLTLKKKISASVKKIVGSSKRTFSVVDKRL